MVKVSVASVVRDVAMYECCVLGNQHLAGCDLVMLDNRVENLTVTKRYNDFLDGIDDDRWIVLCHEDWEIKEDIIPVLERLDKGRLYGPIGVFIEEKKNVDVLVMKGWVEQSSKDGGKTIVIKGKELEGRVDTFDCQCLIMHSSLVRAHSLRFDENLRFDMYVEDFCVGAYEKAGIESYAVKISCHHHSGGKLSQAFVDSVNYVRQKYSRSLKRYATIVGRLNTFGGDPSRPVFKWKRIPWIMLRYKLSR
jgi:hypothetical protein